MMCWRAMAVVAGLLAMGVTGARGEGFFVPGGGTFDPFLVALKPEVRLSVLPAWMVETPRVDGEAEVVEVPVPAVWREPAVGVYAVTVVFDDDGSGGPVVEWVGGDGEVRVLSHGLGEDGEAVGFHSRTVLVPEGLSREGGLLRVAWSGGGGGGLLGVAVRPGRLDTLAVLGGRRTPALVEEDLVVREDREVNGGIELPLTGDVRDGTIVEAELWAPVAGLEGEIEFKVPINGVVEGAVLRMEALGLDPEARIVAAVNGVDVGAMNFPVFRLDDPSLVTDWNGSLVVAGWREGSLFVPARLLEDGDNSVVVGLRRSDFETGRAVFLRNSMLEVRFAPRGFEPDGEGGRKVDFTLPVDGVELGAPDYLLPDVVLPALPEGFLDSMR